MWQPGRGSANRRDNAGVMRDTGAAWFAPAVFSLLAAALFLAFGDYVAVATAVWFCWCMTRIDDAEHRVVRYFGWFMLTAIASMSVGRFALG
jgi:hypothetical protein